MWGMFAPLISLLILEHGRVNLLRPGINPAAQVLETHKSGREHDLNGLRGTNASPAEQHVLPGWIEFGQVQVELSQRQVQCAGQA